MNKDILIQEIVKIIRKRLSRDYRVLLFGSWAKGNALETSDIDIGILGKEEISWNEMAKIKDEVDDIPTLRKIDIVDLISTEVKFKENVLKYAKAL
ncbi:nucleotidyltransferase domain-containing protein [Candidatus Wolfebacteria bacterium]|nr:nucleotidyltransferase domain-containing protein [Candidatus Wolfebacteria bacterium]